MWIVTGFLVKSSKTICIVKENYQYQQRLVKLSCAWKTESGPT